MKLSGSNRWFVNREVDNTHISASNRQIIERLYGVFSPEAKKAEHRTLRRAAYRYAMRRHADNHQEYVAVISGNLSLLPNREETDTSDE